MKLAFLWDFGWTKQVRLEREVQGQRKLIKGIGSVGGPRCGAEVQGFCLKVVRQMFGAKEMDGLGLDDGFPNVYGYRASITAAQAFAYKSQGERCR